VPAYILANFGAESIASGISLDNTTWLVIQLVSTKDHGWFHEKAPKSNKSDMALFVIGSLQN
jgi:hypothetical protein